MNQAGKVKSALMATLAIPLVLTACGGGGDKKEESSPSPAGSGPAAGAGDSAKLRITWAGSQPRHDATLRAIELYKTVKPEVTFEPEYMGFDTYFTKLATQSAARSLPDIMQIDTSNIGDYAARGQLLELGGINTADIESNLMNAGNIDGKQYGIPIGANAIALMYNKVAFEKLGVAIPDEGYSWDEWVELARKLQPQLEKGKYVLEDFSVSTITQESDKYEIYQLSKGKGFLHTPDGKFNIDKDTYVEFANLFADLRKEGLVPPVDVSVGHKANDPKLDNFLNGTILIKRDYAAALPNYDSVNPGQYAATVVPHAEHSGAWLVPAQFFTVSAFTERADEAKAFIDWFINDVEAGRALGMSRGPQVSKKVLEELGPTMTDIEKAQIDIIDRTAATANPFTSRPKGYGAWTDEYSKISHAVGFGQMTPEEGFEAMKKKWDEIVK